MKKRMLSLVLALVLALSLLPTAAVATEKEAAYNIKDASKTYMPFVQLFGKVRDLADSSDASQALDYTVPDDGVTVLLFFRANGVCMNSNRVMDEIGQTAWAKNEKVNIIGIECTGADKATTQSYIDTHDAAGIMDRVYCGSSSIAYWYASLVQHNGDMTGVTSVAGVAVGFGFAIIVTKGEDGNYIRYSLQSLTSAQELTAFVGEFVDTSGDVGDIEDYQNLYTTEISTHDRNFDDTAEELRLLNAYRVSKGLNELERDALMEWEAMQRAGEIAVYYSHTRPDHTQDTRYAENIGAGYATPAAVMEAWLNSEGHRQNIETAAYKSVGLGCFEASDGTKYWVQLFSTQPQQGGALGVGGDGYSVEMEVAQKFLQLSAAPASVDLKVGETATVTLCNTNQGFPSGVSKICTTSRTSANPSVATVGETNDGEATTITAVKAGTTTVKVGLASAGSGTPLTVDVAVTVTENSAAPSPSPRPVALDKAMFTVDVTNETYTGTAITKTITGADDGTDLVEGTDYTVTYKNNTNAGTATITIAGKGAYTGTLTYTFTIDPKVTTTVELKMYGYVSAQATPWEYEFDTSGVDMNGLVYTRDKDGSFGLFDTITNKEIVPCKYDVMEPFSDGLAIVCVSDGETGKYGYIDLTGKEVIPCRYDSVGDFSDGLASVYLNGQMGYIDRTGKMVFTHDHEYAWEFHDGLAVVGGANNKWGLIDKTGKEVIPCIYDYAGYGYGYSSVVGGPCYGAYIVCEGTTNREDAAWSLVTPAGDLVRWKYDLGLDGIGAFYYPRVNFSEGLGAVSLDGKYGYIDQEGNEVIACQYDYAGGFSEGLARVEMNGKWGYIDQAGNLVIPCQYDAAEDFFDGLAEVRAGDRDTGEWIYIDQAGAEVTKTDTDTYLTEDLRLVKQDGKVGLANAAGEELIPCRYDAVYSWVEGAALVGLDGKVMFVNGEGEELETNVPIPTPINYCNYFTGVYYDTRDWNWAGGFIYEFDDEDLLYLHDICTFTVKTTTEGGTTSGDDDNGGGNSSGNGSGGSSGNSSSGGGGGSSSGGGGSSGGSAGGGGSSAPAAPKPASEKFTDVVKDSWYEQGVTFVTDKGLFQGVAQGVFAPDTNMTRAMLMTVLARLDGLDTSGGETWYAKGMDWAMANGISDGTMPDSNVTREQLVTMLYRYAWATAGWGDLSAFVDGDSVSGWAVDAMIWAVNAGIITGKDGKRLDPQGTATRAEVATIIRRFVESK